MVRTQIQLTEEQARRLRSLASERGTSMAAVIRDVLDRALHDDNRAQRRARALAAAGRFHSGDRDVSVSHDRYLADAFAE